MSKREKFYFMEDIILSSVIEKEWHTINFLSDVREPNEQ